MISSFHVCSVFSHFQGQNLTPAFPEMTGRWHLDAFFGEKKVRATRSIQVIQQGWVDWDHRNFLLGQEKNHLQHRVKWRNLIPLLSYLRGRVVSQLSVVLRRWSSKGDVALTFVCFSGSKISEFQPWRHYKAIVDFENKEISIPKKKKVLKKNLYIISLLFDGSMDVFFFEEKTSLVVAICLDCAMPSQEALEIGNAFGWAGNFCLQKGVWWRWFNM